MSKVLSFRVSDEEAEWADEYVKARGLKRQDFLASGFRSYRVDCMGGVPDVEPEPHTVTQVSESRKAADEWSKIMGGRQARLRKEMGW